MGKRSREDDYENHEDSLAKRHRPLAEDRLSKLSDELILRIFSFLSVPDLVLCQMFDYRITEYEEHHIVDPMC